MPPLSIMLKPASGKCNMRCKYCFYHSITDAREIPDFGFLSSDTADEVIKKALAFADGESVYFAFQGGEPLLAGKSFFKNFIASVNEKNTKNSRVYYALQTNGTLIDEEWTEIFRNNGFLVGLSLDGDRNDNLFRLNGDFSPAFNKIDAAAKMLQNANVDFNIIAVVTGNSADNIERIYKYFTSCGYKHLQFIPCLRPFGDKTESKLYMTENQYAEYLIRLFNRYVKDYADGKYVSIRHFDNMVRLFLGQNSEQCGMNGRCSHQFVIESDGSVYPCDFYCLDEYKLGNIKDGSFKEFATSKIATDFIKESLPVPEKCKSCQFYRVCRGGGCKRQRADRDYCQSYKSFFSKCLPLFRVFIGEKPKA